MRAIYTTHELIQAMKWKENDLPVVGKTSPVYIGRQDTEALLEIIGRQVHAYTT